MDKRNIAIACQGGGSHAAYAAGVLQTLLPKLDEHRQKLQLVGISGTSGGAICALLAWYGLLQGGPESAIRKLDEFWRDNSAWLPGEQLSNEVLGAGLASLPFEIQFSPYEFPMPEINEIITGWWPQAAQVFGLSHWWMRPGYFRLDDLVSRHVDFGLIAAIGNFFSIPRDIKRWREADMQFEMFQQFDARKTKLRLEERIRRHLLLPDLIRQRMRTGRFSETGLLTPAFDAWVDSGFSDDPAALTDLSRRVLDVSSAIPQLLIGAVDIGSGEFTAFSSERAEKDGGVSLDAVLASAALPWIFKAVQIEQENQHGDCEVRQYWDGLFSQNPPIKNFVSGLVDKTRKPDEIWVAQINPSAYNRAQLRHDIWDRRNELSGNLSLNQEIGFIDAINRRIEQDGTSHRNERYVQVHRIAMESEAVEKATGLGLGLGSKLDRRIALKNALIDHGREQAASFLPVRDFIEEVCNDDWGIHPRPLDNVIAATASALNTPPRRTEEHMRMFVDETVIRPGSLTGNSAQVTVRWHTQVTSGSGDQQVTLEGLVDFGVENGKVARRELLDLRVADIKPLKMPTVPEIPYRKQ